MISELFEAQAARTPASTALIDVHGEITYRTLDDLANRISRAVVATDTPQDAPVCICVEHSAGLIAATLGVLKTGRHYVIADTSWPPARIRTILRDCNAPVLLVSGNASIAAHSYEGTLTLDVSGPLVATQPAVALDVPQSPGQLLSVVYTSGSTGKPQGVLISQTSLLTNLKWIWETLAFRHDDVALLHRSAAVVGFGVDCFGPLLRGIPLVIAPDTKRGDPAAIATLAIAHRVTHISMSPGLLHAVILLYESHTMGAWPSLRLCKTSGDLLRPDIVRRWYAIFPDVPLINVYGATECPLSASMNTLGSGDMYNYASIPVGVPAPDVAVFVLDDALNPVPPRTRGRLYIAGPHLSPGYVNSPWAVSDRFVDGRFGSHGRLFRTGDIGEWTPDGRLLICGRADNQVKIRGFRVELEEVEAAIRTCAGVLDTAVISDENEIERILVAYVVAEAGRSITPIQIRSHLRQRVPHYMVPRHVVISARLERTMSGKVDRVALRSIAQLSISTDSDASLGASAEQIMTALWTHVLGVTDIDVDDDFFDIGGDSLAAMRLLAATTERFGVSAPMSLLLSTRTVRRFTQALPQQVSQ